MTFNEIEMALELKKESIETHRNTLAKVEVTINELNTLITRQELILNATQSAVRNLREQKIVLAKEFDSLSKAVVITNDNLKELNATKAKAIAMRDSHMKQVVDSQRELRDLEEAYSKIDPPRKILEFKNG